MHALGVVHKDAVMPQQLPSPRLKCSLGVLHATRLHMLNIGLDLDTVQVLVQTIHQILAELLAVIIKVSCDKDDKHTQNAIPPEITCHAGSYC